MRRISAKFAKSTMSLGRPLYDCFGRLLLKEGTRLSASQVSGFEDYGVGELIIVDKRVNDVTAWPLITPELEGSLSLSLRQVLQKTQHIISTGKAQMLDLSQLRDGISEMVQQLFPVAMGEPVIAGCYSTKDYDFVHPVKVTSLSLLMGQAAGMEQEELINLGMASLLQNIGYAGLPQGIMDKRGPLTKEEKNIVQKHVVLGAEIVRRYGQVDQETSLIIRQHHERWNGNGYPQGLSARNICHGARILAITDSVVALVSMRPHHGCILPQGTAEFVDAFSGDLNDAEFEARYNKLCGGRIDAWVDGDRRDRPTCGKESSAPDSLCFLRWQCCPLGCWTVPRRWGLSRGCLKDGQDPRFGRRRSAGRPPPPGSGWLRCGPCSWRIRPATPSLGRVSSGHLCYLRMPPTPPSRRVFRRLRHPLSGCHEPPCPDPPLHDLRCHRVTGRRLIPHREIVGNHPYHEDVGVVRHPKRRHHPSVIARRRLGWLKVRVVAHRRVWILYRVRVGHFAPILDHSDAFNVKPDPVLIQGLPRCLGAPGGERASVSA